jgi:Protein of unknown function (DUF3465)
VASGHDLEALKQRRELQGDKMAGRKHSRIIGVIAIALVLVALALLWHSRPGYEVRSGFTVIEDAYRYRQTGFMAEVDGTVARILMDDQEDQRNQKFTIRLTNGQMLLVIHDQEAAGRVPVSVGDRVLVRGEYVWTETGGTLRYTQHDYSPRRLHGWIDHNGERYD